MFAALFVSHDHLMKERGKRFTAAVTNQNDEEKKKKHSSMGCACPDSKNATSLESMTLPGEGEGQSEAKRSSEEN